MWIRRGLGRGEGGRGDEIILEAHLVVNAFPTLPVLLYGRKTDFNYCIATDVRCLTDEAILDISDSYPMDSYKPIGLELMYLS